MSTTDAQAGTRPFARLRWVVFLTVSALLAAVLVPIASQSAFAGAGSLLRGVVWADVNSDGLRTADESLKTGVTVELLSSPTGPVVATTTSAANGTYSFANVADGDFYVRVVAPGAFDFPDVATGQNVFHRAEVPTVGNPERGLAGPITVAGNTQSLTLDAGMQPVSTLKVERMQIQNACEGYAETGSAPWDAADGPGLDTGPSNCIVRVGDTVMQNYSVSLDGLPTGVSVPNVVLEMKLDPVSDPDDPSDLADSTFRLAGPGANGLPAGCLDAGSGGNPPSSATTNADGSITVICNMGPMSSAVGSVQLVWAFAGNTPIPGFGEVTARAYTGQDDAAPSNTVQGPVVEVTGTAQWEARKSLLTPSNGHGVSNQPILGTKTINGVATPGFYMHYWIDLVNLKTEGGSDLQWPITFTDRMTQFPNAVLDICSPRRIDNVAVTIDWSVTCELNTAAGADGWQFSVAKPTNSQFQATRIIVRVFVPTDDAFVAVDPAWEHGDAPPAGTVAWENHVEDTDGWHLNGGQPNNPPGGIGPGFEAGWDGTTASGDNVVSGQLPNTTPSWDLAKTVENGAVYVNGANDNNPLTPAVPGFQLNYRFDIQASNASLLTPMIDNIAFKDVMSQYPDAVLLNCWQPWDLGAPTCETGAQPADGWDMSVVPSRNGINQHRATWLAAIFIPVPELPHPCVTPTNQTFSIINEARDTDGWTADGWPINGTGLEPGWDPAAGPTASGNNRNSYTFNIRNTVTDCGVLRGDKQYSGLSGGITAWNQFSLGDVVRSNVSTTATNERVSVTNLTMCDVFDVSVWRFNGDPLAPITGTDPNPHLEPHANIDRSQYVIEYGIGANAVDTQTGVGNGLNNTTNVNDVVNCRTNPGPWATDPATAFGADWRDRVNMVRVRPLDPTRVETGPFTFELRFTLQSRWQYNGGPNAGEDIPQGVLLNNSGGWPETDANGAIIWDTVSRQVTANLPMNAYKAYTNAADNAWADNTTVASGTRVTSRIGLFADMWDYVDTSGRLSGVQAPGAADTRGFPIDDPTVCDVFDVSVFALDGLASSTPSRGLDNPADYIIEYGIGSNSVDTQAGPVSGGLYPVDRSSIVSDVTGCRENTARWETDPTAFGADWQDRVNMVRIRPIDPDHTEYAGFSLEMRVPLRVRSSYNGGPNDGEAMLTGVRLSNTGGFSTGPRGDNWTTMQKEVRYQGMRLAVAKSVGQATYLPGQDAIWNLSIGINDAPIGAVMENVRLVDTIPTGLIYNPTCTQSRLPAGVTVSYNAATREVTFSLGDITATAANYWVRTGATAIQLCATLESVAQPGDTYVNTVRAVSPSSQNTPTANATTRATGSGQLGLVKNVDKPFVASGETYAWSLEWANTSTVIDFQPTDIIDVLPWNGDGDPAVGSARGQFSSDYEGLAQLTGPLAAPTYIRGDTGDVTGTWYYTTAAPATLSHDPRNAANADPAAAGGLWRTAAEISDFGTVTGVRFVSDEWLAKSTRVQARITAVSTSNELNNVYVNRAMIFSNSFPNQPLLSNEPYVLMPGFTLGDLVWIDPNGNGKLDAGEQGAAGVAIEVLNEDGDVVTTATTDANGRWSVTRIPAGEYRVRIPASMFQAGGPLAEMVVRTVGSSDANDPNENVDNNNTATPDPASTGLTSTPVLLSYEYVNAQLVGANGPTGDDVAGLAPPLIPDAFSTFSVDLALLPGPHVDIEKSTNGQDADTPTGPNVRVGDPVRWTYVVTNTGDVNLTNVTVTDDLVDATDIDCAGTGSNVVPGPLAPEATFTCVATSVATLGQYENVGTVTGLDPTAVEVTDEDPSHYFGMEPAVDIEKATNGQDADDPTGPLVTVGGAVRWTYVVTNTGNVPLTNVIVTDNLVAADDIDCAGTGSNVVPGPLAAGASVTCVANGTATLGQYVNQGSVVGTGPEATDVDGNPVAGEEVADEDLSHYLGIEPAVDIEKATNGQDADTPTGPLVAVGDPVEWTYVVTNTGTTDLTDVTVTDDLVAADDIDCDDTGSNVIAGPLAPGETFTCVATGVATAGQYANVGTVVGTGPETTDVNGDPVPGQAVADLDPSHYFGVVPTIDIEKATNGQDADTPTGPNVTVGGEVRWTYVVTNTGNVPLTGIVVTDDQVAADEIDCDATRGNVITGPLAPGGSFTCVATGTATAGQYANLGTVVGTGPETTDVEGDPVPGDVVTDADPSHYFGIEPSIDIEKATNTLDADQPTGPIVNEGGAVRWTYVVTNTGNAPLTDVTVTDDLVAASEIDCDDTGGNVIAGPLAPGASFTCVADGTAIAGQYANVGTVVGTAPETTDVDGNPVAGVVVTDGDPSHYFGITPAIDIEKATNTLDADEPTGPLVAVGGPVRWTYVVTNTGTAPLTDVTVTDDQVDAADIDCAESGSNVVPGPLEPGASFTCVADGTAVAGQYANLGSVTGVGPETTDVDGNAVAGVEVSDEDPSHYFGAEPAIDIEKATNGQDADEPTGPSVPAGGSVEWTYVVTNTGNVPLTDIVVTDDKVAAGDIWCADTESNTVAGPLAPGDSFTCNAFGSAIPGQYANLGTVTAVGPTTTGVDGDEVPGDEVTDEDPSHYFGTTTPPPPIPPALPVTGGSNSLLPIGAGALLLGAGLLVVLLARRRKDGSSAE